MSPENHSCHRDTVSTLTAGSSASYGYHLFQREVVRTVVWEPTTSKLNNGAWRRATYRAWAMGFPCRQHVL